MNSAQSCQRRWALFGCCHPCLTVRPFLHRQSRTCTCRIYGKTSSIFFKMNFIRNTWKGLRIYCNFSREISGFIHWIIVIFIGCYFENVSISKVLFSQCGFLPVLRTCEIKKKSCPTVWNNLIKYSKFNVKKLNILYIYIYNRITYWLTKYIIL